VSPIWWPSLSLTCLRRRCRDQDGGAAPVAGDEGDLLLQLGAEAPPVEQTGEGVVVREVLEPLLEAVALADVLQLQDRVGVVAGASGRKRGVYLAPDLLAARVRQRRSTE
jgi:hypothetical protein